MLFSSFILLFFCVAVHSDVLELRNDVAMETMIIQVDIGYRYSKTRVETRFQNYGVEPKETIFDFQIPKGAFITNFTMETEPDVIYVGEVEEIQKAEKKYKEAKKKGKGAVKITAKPKPRDATDFKMAVNVKAGSQTVCRLQFEQLLQRRFGVYEQVVIMNPGQVVSYLQVNVYIVEPTPITRLYVPDLRNIFGLLEENLDREVNALATVQHDKGTGLARISYSPTVEEQEMASSEGIQGQFVVQYDVASEDNVGSIEIEGDYFVHYLSPRNLPVLNKHMTFVLDVSGSMYGDKIRQLKEAMHTMLDELHSGDLFNILKFSSSVEFWRWKAAPANREWIRSAKYFVGELVAQGGTNINMALSEAISNVRVEQSSLAKIIFFLSDGEPTSGRIDPYWILENVKRSRPTDVSLYSVGFGAGADMDLLNKLAWENQGIAVKIYEDKDAAIQMKQFYHSVNTPLLSDVQLKYPDKSVVAESLTSTYFPSYQNGTEIVVVGRLSDPSSAGRFFGKVEGKGAYGVVRYITESELDTVPSQQTDERRGFIERTWAYQWVQELINKKNVAPTEGERQKFHDQALDVSLKYNFVIPGLTAIIVIEPDRDEVRGLENFVDEPEFDMKQYSRPGHTGQNRLSGMPDVVYAMSKKSSTTDFRIEHAVIIISLAVVSLHFCS